MFKKATLVLCVVFVFVSNIIAWGEQASDKFSDDVLTIWIEHQHPQVSVGGKSALALHFELKKDWHFYASAKTAPGQMNLKINPVEKDSGTILFGETIFPQGEIYFDKFSNRKLDVFSGNFTLYIPFETAADMTLGQGGFKELLVDIGITGAVCSDVQCRPVKISLITKVIAGSSVVMSEGKFTLPAVLKTEGTKQVLRGVSSDYPVLFAFGLAFLAGFSLNIMPCVWPVLPIIVMRLVEQSKESRGRSVTMGLAFCVGILLFFACLAGANAVLQIFYGTVLQWGDQFRNPAFVAGMAILLVILALFMFGVFSIGLSSSITGKSSSGKGFSGAVGMGFLAAILSTPCSFGILVAAFGWAQTQPLFLATLAIMIMGIGMATPYAVLTSMPRLLSKLPKAGVWMELFKQAVGFVLLGIAVWLIAALPGDRRVGVLYFSVILGFGLWMWGTWVTFSTAGVRKFVIRIIAIVLVVWAGFTFLTRKAELIDWQKYDANVIEKALSQNRPVLIKFMADWCMSCKVVEKVVYSRKDVAALIKKASVLAVKADTTTLDNEATAALKNVYHEPGVPVTILLMPDGKEIRWHDKFFADELKEYLEQ